MDELTKQKISSKLIGKIVSDETREKLRQSHLGKKRGKPTPETIDKIKSAKTGKKHTEETKIKLRKSRAKQVSKPHTPETKLKMRLAAIKNINSKCGQIAPNYNPLACEIFNQLMEQTGTIIQHAENGGEFYIKELGYWVDGYDKENNIVYEYDEPRHFNHDGSLCKKDIQRQEEIVNFLNCKFIRIKA